jgi:hypothetical protein
MSSEVCQVIPVRLLKQLSEDIKKGYENEFRVGRGGPYGF